MDLYKHRLLCYLEESYVFMRSGKAEIYDKMLASADAEEGPKAFSEKHDPIWKGE
ncbi:MAG: hypothetical protein AAF902_19300 [Chloroflexota bacterium]